MSTRSLTQVLDARGSVLVTLYRQWDGYIDGGMGDELIEFVKGMVVGNGINLTKNPPKFANGIECLAAQLVSHLKGDQVGQFYLYPEDAEPEEFNYKIFLHNGVLTLTVSDGENERQLYPTSTSNEVTTEERVVEFLYPVGKTRIYDGEYDVTKDLWRKIKVIEQTDEYIIGTDADDEHKFKRFRIDRIVGGVSKIFETKF